MVLIWDAIRGIFFTRFQHKRESDLDVFYPGDVRLAWGCTVHILFLEKPYRIVTHIVSNYMGRCLVMFLPPSKELSPGV